MEKAAPLLIIVDDDANVRSSVESMGCALGYSVETYANAASLFAGLDPDDKREKCLLLDLLLPEMDGLDVIEQLNERGIAIPVVLITGRLESDVAVMAMRGGAVNCVQKPFSLGRMKAVVEDALDLATNISMFHEARKHHVRFGRLTDQEKHIVRLAADGYPNKQIASRLGLSIKTVEKYRRRAYATLNVDCTARMARAITLHSMHNMLHSPKSERESRTTSSI